MKYDYLIVGAGLFGSTFAYLAAKAGKRCLVIDRRPHIGGGYIAKKLKELMYTNMGLTYSILQIMAFGNLSTPLSHLIDIPIAQ